ncbi:MAG: hypothetical protein WC648_01265 [Candidatus Paceibacterota bacterium]|jgi:hypothetical protein
MPTQQEQFDTALKGLTPDERATYTKANPSVNVGGVNQSLNGSTGGYQAITSESLQPQSPMKLPTPTPLTGAVGLQGAIEQGTASYTASRDEEKRLAEQNAALKAKETDMTTSKQSLMDKILGRESKTALEDTTYSETVDPARKELDDINSQILASQRAQQNEIKSIERETMSEGQKAVVERDINRKYISEQADLAVIQYARQNNYARAKEIADRKIAVVLEKDAQDIELLKFAYEENKEAFNKDETRQYNEMITEKERAHEENKTAMKTLSDTKLDLLKSASEQSAPNSILQAIQSAETPEQALIAAGKFGGDILEKELKRAQIDKAVADAKEALNGKSDVKLTSGQQAALGYANRVADANKIINDIGGNFTGLGSIVGGMIPNTLKTSERQQFEQAQRNFINAVLRRESGAAVSPDEFDSARKQYFPQPGDQTEVLEQKQLNRERTLENLLREGGQDVDTPVQQTVVTIGKQKVLSGTIIQNASGQKARVNPDGTVTPI